MRSAATSEVDDERKAHRDPSKALREVKGKKKASREKEDDNWDVEDSMSLRVNYDKFNVLIRNEMLMKSAEDKWNAAAAEVLRAILAASLSTQTEARDIRTEQGVGLTSIVDEIPTSKHKLLMAGMAGSSSKNTPEIVRQYLAVMSCDDLASDQTVVRYLSHSTHQNPTYWVEIEAICTSLKANLLTELVRERIDEKAARILAVIARVQIASEHMASAYQVSC